jgi:monovalent cation:H+ antiporter-2, CPA2 family
MNLNRRFLPLLVLWFLSHSSTLVDSFSSQQHLAARWAPSRTIPNTNARLSRDPRCRRPRRLHIRSKLATSLSQFDPRQHHQDHLSCRVPSLWGGKATGTWRLARDRVRRTFSKILRWQAKRRRSILSAAAIAVSLALVSSHQIDAYNGVNLDSNYVAANNRPAIEIVQHSPTRDYGSRFTENLARTTTSMTVASTSSVHMPRGGGKVVEKKAEDVVVTATKKTFKEAFKGLANYMQGPKSDTLLLLLATALITPLCKSMGTSPILGFLASGMLLGPNGFGLISGIHTTETLAELGIVFFLFEMGIELSFNRLMSMRKDVFGLGFSQFVATALAVAGIGKLVGLPSNALVVLGGGLALSSSAFVLQLLKDKDQLATRFGKAAFGVLLFQDLAVVPLLVVTPILAGSGQGLASAVGSALVKAAMALGAIAFAGRVVLNPMFKMVAGAKSQEAFLGLILLTVLSMSFLTEGLGLSNTLGAFLAGVLLSETKYRYQVEADIAPFRGILLGLFFVTVGFEIDVGLIASNLPLVGSLVMGIIVVKAVLTTLLSLAFGLSLSTSQQTGLILSQGGEFAFVAFGLARSLGILDVPTTKLMLTCVSLTMAMTPALASLGSKIAKSLEEKSDFTHYLGQDRDANEIKESDDFAVVVGYGAVGKVRDCSLIHCFVAE